MEPVTYLVGLSTLICGYLWFLYHNREVSYRSALNLTISRRQSRLYELKGFDIQKWESMIEEGNAIPARNQSSRLRIRRAMGRNKGRARRLCRTSFEKRTKEWEQKEVQGRRGGGRRLSQH